jgi:integrase
MLTLMFNTGARVSEIVGVRVSDVVLGPSSSIRLHGKGRKQRSLPLWKSTAQAIRHWLQLNPQLRAEAPLLPRRDGCVMSRANVAQRLALAVDLAAARHPQRMRPAKSSCGSEMAQGCSCPRHFIADTWTLQESNYRASGHGGGMRRSSESRLCRRAGNPACRSQPLHWPMA